ncbi:lytic transglycosylase domain-containing protein [Methylacidimicrobium sp. B4]|uniref:lytic transglycosylase domain-containing protein n=1 Tax=Methylacidimicrobium sp. B4 TaxID=2796139 RepID=UPI001A8D98E8|nr:lytic transglycosylase domain-containing protein [Methylacidimicrobium sp. B4]QSR83959.1 lytic transglycosylase domain-containing protein [Methylacidimicrobium sp. B4]
MRRAFLGAAALIFLLLLGYWVWRSSIERTDSRYDAEIREASMRYGVDPLLIRSVIWEETHFRPNKIGRVGEVGLMQVRPTTALDWARSEKRADFRPEQLTDPQIGILAGSWYLARALRHWQETDNPYVFALAEYNAGRRNAIRWVDPARPKSSRAFLARIDFPRTKEYVREILGRYAIYRGRLPWGSYRSLFSRMGVLERRKESAAAGQPQSLSGSVPFPGQSGNEKIGLPSSLPGA